ncbi:MAG: VTT domain-containing protein [Opitutaceae bacterium]|nr:VTT domain-containing protein [Opitutaceae bacterium]
MNDIVEWAMNLAANGGPTALIALALATLLTEDLTCIAAGLLVARGSLAFWPATGACYAGILFGDLLLVLMGRTIGRPSLRVAPLKWWLSEELVARAERWFTRRGPGIVFASRFMPGTRVPTYFAAGVLRAPFMRFAAWFALACAIWVPLLVGTATWLGTRATEMLATWTSAVPALLGAGLLAWLVAQIGLGLATWRGRRLLLCRWRRLTRFEFWPRWVVYAPVLLQILWLAFRHRSLALVTAVNPGIGAGGGLVGESKSEILRGLAGAGERVAKWSRIEAGGAEKRVAALEGFMADHALAFPIVLKPDVGERGDGVVIARDESQARAAMEVTAGPLIAQAYVPGVEFGVFYHRRPSADCGEVLAVTDKRLVGVTGDGKRCLEDLILADDRAICMAPFFLKKFTLRLDDVPAAGERVMLGELGTHCRGALFLDGTALATPALRAEIERVSRAFEGFHFGRYDVRAPSAEAFQRGEFTVIELNGLTSEATSIYDPRHGAWHGWRTLCRQWRIAYAIAAENRARGKIPLTLGEVWRLLVAHMRGHDHAQRPARRDGTL